MKEVVGIYIVVSLLFYFIVRLFAKDKSDWVNDKRTCRLSVYAITITMFIYAIITIAFATYFCEV